MTVDSGNVLNPWGYLERAGTAIDLESECQSDDLDGYCDGSQVHRDWHSTKVREGRPVMFQLCFLLFKLEQL